MFGFDMLKKAKDTLIGDDVSAPSTLADKDNATMEEREASTQCFEKRLIDNFFAMLPSLLSEQEKYDFLNDVKTMLDILYKYYDPYDFNHLKPEIGLRCKMGDRMMDLYEKIIKMRSGLIDGNA